MKLEFDVAVVGGGPAGMMAAASAARLGARTVLLEKNAKLGRKLMITGKGRCNVCNQCDVQSFIGAIPGNGRFLYSAVNRFSPLDTMDYFEGLHVPLKTERGNRVFPVSDRAADIVDAMKEDVEASGVHVLQEDIKALIIEDGAVKGVKAASGKRIQSDSVIVACGGLSYPGTGSTGDGYRLARQAGHTIVPTRPSLVPLVCREDWCQELQGLSLRNIAVQVLDRKQGKEIYRDFGEMLFTHFGVSGPVILSASAHMRDLAPERYEIRIDLKPGLNFEQLDLRLQRDFQKFQNRDFSNSLQELLPKKFIPVAVNLSGIPGEKKCHQISRQERMNFGRLLKSLPVTISGFRPIEEAIVTAGGVSVNELSPKTMESKLVKRLFFAGEVLDVDGYTGGFNLQIAFSTGYLAGNSIWG